MVGRSQSPAGRYRMGMVQVTKARLEQLEAKERAHDDYMVGIRLAQARYLEYPKGMFLNGYGQALRDMAEGILRAGRERDGA